jgi:hypothetical protein
MAHCAIDEAMRRVETYNAHLRGEIAKKTAPLFREEDELNWRAKHSNLPVSQSISRQDLVRALRLNFRIMILRSEDLVNSRYLRNVRVIVKAANLALQMRDGITIDDSHSDALYQKVAISALSVDPHSNVTTSGGDCSVDAALFALERLGMDHVDFQVGGVDTDRNIEYVHTIENLRTLNKIAITELQTNMDEVYQSEQRKGFSDRFGKTWKAKLLAGSNKLKAYNQVLTMIGSAIPSDFEIENQRAPDAAKRRHGVVAAKDSELHGAQ